MYLPNLEPITGDANPRLPTADFTTVSSAPHSLTDSLLGKFIEAHATLERHRSHPVKIDGHTLTTAAVVAAARYFASVELDDRKEVIQRVEKTRQVVADKVASGASIYGLSTGFGGSGMLSPSRSSLLVPNIYFVADTRTDKPLKLGDALLQHQHIGILPTTENVSEILPLQDPAHSTTMPEAWVRYTAISNAHICHHTHTPYLRAAILIRMNSLIRGHSGVRYVFPIFSTTLYSRDCRRWELIDKMRELLSANIIPVVPLRGSISASGGLSMLLRMTKCRVSDKLRLDLMPLSYIAGAIGKFHLLRSFADSYFLES